MLVGKVDTYVEWASPLIVYYSVYWTVYLDNLRKGMRISNVREPDKYFCIASRWLRCVPLHYRGDLHVPAPSRGQFGILNGRRAILVFVCAEAQVCSVILYKWRNVRLSCLYVRCEDI